MPTVDVVDLNNQKVGQVDLADEVFALLRCGFCCDDFDVDLVLEVAVDRIAQVLPMYSRELLVPLGGER